MQFAFTEEQRELRRTVRTLLDRRGTRPVRDSAAPKPGYDRDLWQRLAQQIGAHGLAIPERYGGAGFGLLESSIVVAELGRGLVDIPFFSSAVLSAQALLHTDDPVACERLLPGISSGDSIVALAWAERGQGWPTSRSTTTARRDGDAWLLDGVKTFVLDGAQADAVLVVAHSHEGLSLFELAPQAISESLVESTPMDLTRSMAGFRLSGAPATLIGTEGGAEPVLSRCLDVAAAALAAEQVAAADRWLHEIVAYTKMRHQFGRAIGSFQAIKHRLADLYVSVESARSLADAANWAVAEGDGCAREWAAMAKSYCSEAYCDVAAEGIQLHGGIGVTWEHEAHLHLKRAHSSAQLFGTPRHHRRRLEDLLSLTRSSTCPSPPASASSTR